jgi:uncharacterized protein YdeI (YjbR/CyaY-like superfamily)
MKPRFFLTAAGFRTWLDSNHGRAQELWVGFRKKQSGKASITYPEAVDEALCYGWIDGVRKSVDEQSYTIRFTPRCAKSYWSAVNIRRVAGLTKRGRMREPGIKAFQERERKKQKYSYENRPQKLEPKFERKFRENPRAWTFFQGQAAWYRRTASFWVLSAKQEDTRWRRLSILIGDSEQGRRLGLMTPAKKS